MTTPIRSGEISVDRATLKYEIVGNGTPVIVLHGGPGIGYRYLLPELSDSLSDGAQLIFYDQRASGQSTGLHAPELLTISKFVDDLTQVYATLGLRQAIVLGHSFGGLLALQFALQNPDSVAGLVLIDPDPASKAFWARYPEHLQLQSQEDKVELQAIRNREGWQGEKSQVARYFELVLKPYFADASHMPSHFGQRFAQTRPENLFETSPIVRQGLGNWDLYPNLERLAIQTLIVTGDKSIFPQEAFVRLEESLPHATVITLPRVAHFPQIEAAAAFREIVRNFIGEHKNRSV